VLLFSGGKDSIVMLHLAIKAFAPGRLPFPVMHVDTGHNFDEVIATRDALVARYGLRLVVASVQDDIDAGRVVDNGPSRNPLQTVTLLRGIRENTFDAAFGGARRDEEKARAKERVQLPRRVRPVGPQGAAARTVEPVQRAPPQGRAHPGVPAVNWTEYDIWAYIGAETIELPGIYYAHTRPVFQRRHAAGRSRVHAAARRRAGVRESGAVPHRRRRDLHRLRRSPPRPPSTR
jgi:sulfate adenylyltransferase subunit 2